jgi:hypothetical protein
MNATPKIIYYYFNFGHYLLSKLFKICYLKIWVLHSQIAQDVRLAEQGKLQARTSMSDLPFFIWCHHDPMTKITS